MRKSKEVSSAGPWVSLPTSSLSHSSSNYYLLQERKMVFSNHFPHPSAVRKVIMMEDLSTELHRTKQNTALLPKAIVHSHNRI